MEAKLKPAKIAQVEHEEYCECDEHDTAEEEGCGRGSGERRGAHAFTPGGRN